MKTWHKILVVCLALFVIVFGIICGVQYYHIHSNQMANDDAPFIGNGTLIISNGETISNSNVKFYENHVEVPVVDVLKSFGYDVVWNSDVTATISKNNRELKLSLKGTPSLQDGYYGELLIPAPGCGYFYCYSVDEDVLVDEVTMKCILSFLDIKIYTDVDTELREIHFDIRTEGSAA